MRLEHDPLAGYNPECVLCPKLFSNSLNVCMEGDGPLDADLMIVGEAPGETEDEMNRPFVGRAGTFLRYDILLPAKVPESAIRFTNTVRCHPAKNRTPTILEIRKCRGYLEAEIRRVRPKVIVGMGNVPLATLLHFFYRGESEEGSSKKVEPKVSGITKWQGKQVWLSEFQCWFIPTFHPSFCMLNEISHSTYSTDLVIADIQKAWKLAQGSRPSFNAPESVDAKDKVRAAAVLDRMERSGSFAFDIETGGSGRSCDKRVIGCSFSCESGRGYYIPWDTLVGSKTLFDQFRKLITSSKYLKIMHNGAYEVRVLSTAHGIPINGVKYFDTMVASHLIDENFSKRLKDLAWVYTAFGGYDVDLERYKYENKIKEDYSQIPHDMLAPYAALDAVATWVIYRKQLPEMRDEGVQPLFDKIVMPVRRVMSDAEINGMRVDLDRAVSLRKDCESTISKLEERVYSFAGREFNIGSNKQLQKVLYDDLRLTPLKETKTGYSTDAESLEYLSTQSGSEIVRVLLDRAYVDTMSSTHVGQAIAYTWPEDGRVHTNYNITGAVTGRASASTPSLQNVPQDRLVRSLYIASEGCKLVEADLKSAEIATVAAVSGEDTFKRAFREGLDIHSETFRRIYDLPSDYECTKLERRLAKTINFGLIYGLTAIGLARRLDMTPEEASEFMNLYFNRLPKVAEWMERQKALVKKNGYVVSVFGRKRRLPLGLSDKWGDISRAERQAMNSPIQSGAADYTYIGLSRLRRAILSNGMEGKIVHTVHDCVIVDAPEYEVDDMSTLILEAFETPVKAMSIGMKVEVEVGDCWGQGNESRLKDIFDSIS